jgi:hypothetical protein
VYPKNHQPGKTRVFVNVVPQTDGFVFRPLLASLIQPDKRYLLSLEFDTPVSSPESHGIALDLLDALRDVQNFRLIPLIRFAPVRWKEGYT